MISFFRLIRIGNLAMLAFTQCLVYFTIVIPILKTSEFTPSLHNWQFGLLVLGTLLIAAGGYAINDYFDVEIDAANQARQGILISRPLKKIIYFACAVTGIIIGLYLTYVLWIRQIALVNLLTAGLLYFYSASYKRMVLVGNFVVSFLTALAVFLPAFADYELQYTMRDIHLPVVSNKMYNLRIIIAIVAGYALFAFLMTFIREIIKDIEDLEGDERLGCKTLPVVAGKNISKGIVQLLIFIVIVLLVVIQYKQQQWENKVAFIYTLTFIQFPLLILMGYLFKSNTKKQFHYAGVLAKLIMLGGILSMPVFNYFS